MNAQNMKKLLIILLILITNASCIYIEKPPTPYIRETICKDLYVCSASWKWDSYTSRWYNIIKVPELTKEYCDKGICAVYYVGDDNRLQLLPIYMNEIFIDYTYNMNQIEFIAYDKYNTYITRPGDMHFRLIMK